MDKKQFAVLVGARMRDLCAKKHVQFLDIARVTGAHPSVVSRWGSGEHQISLHQAAGVAKALGVKVDTLIGGNDDE